MDRVAVLDLGTNTFHLLIARINSDGSFIVIYKEKVPVKLGQGGISKGRIAEEAWGRALDTLVHFKEVIDGYEVGRIVACATSAFRNAANGPMLIDEIYTQTGITIQVISGEEEANHIYQGVKQALPMGTTPSLIMDIGGGSVEFIISNEATVFWKKSYELGGQRLLDRFHRIDPIPVGSVQALHEYLDIELSELHEAVAEFQPKALIGSSGAFNTLSKIYTTKANITVYPEKQTEFPLTPEAFRDIFEMLLPMNKAQRLEVPGMAPMRADMIVVAACLVNFVVSKYHLNRIRVSSYAMKEGILKAVISPSEAPLEI